MKYKELSKLTIEELENKIKEMKFELMKLNAQVAIGTIPKNPKQIRELKKTIARYETLRMKKFHEGIKELNLEIKNKNIEKKYKMH